MLAHDNQSGLPRCCGAAAMEARLIIRCLNDNPETSGFLGEVAYVGVTWALSCSAVGGVKFGDWSWMSEGWRSGVANGGSNQEPWCVAQGLLPLESPPTEEAAREPLALSSVCFSCPQGCPHNQVQ
jgi:hypothetical protein